MKFSIAGTEYDYVTALNKVSLGVLMDLKSQGGPGRRSVDLALHLINIAIDPDGDGDAATIEDDERVMAGMAGLVFIAKRYAGEAMTWADACAYCWGDLQFVTEAGDLTEEDPTAASGEASPPDAETENEPTLKLKTAGTGTSKTSKKASTAA